jgi:hypothetical protein
VDSVSYRYLGCVGKIRDPYGERASVGFVSEHIPMFSVRISMRLKMNKTIIYRIHENETFKFLFHGLDEISE